MLRKLSFSILWLSSRAFSDGLSIEEITVYGKNSNIIGRTNSASEGTISQDDISVRALLRTGDVLESVPGLVATQHSGSGKANQYFLRGFNLDHGTDFATSIDGMPINMRTHGHGQGYTDLNFIIPELVGGIHYKKGPYYSDVGDFSGTGSAAISTAMNGDDKISQGVGENGFYRTLLTGKAVLAEGQFIYGAEYQTYQGPWVSINEDVGKKNLWLKQLWISGYNEYSIEYMAYRNHWNSADQIPERAVKEGLISPLGSIDTTVGGDSSRYSLSASIKHGLDEDTQLRGHLYRILYKMNLWSNFSYFTQPNGDQFQQTDNRNIYGGDVSIIHASQLFGAKMLNTFGLQTRYDNIDKVGLIHTQARQPINSLRTDAVEELSNSLYWQNSLTFTPQLRSLLGFRYDNFSFGVAPLTAENLSSLTSNGGKVNAGITTGSASLIYALNKQQEIYASIGQGFHSNDARGITIKSSPTDNSPVSAVDPLVKTLGYEFGWRGNFENGFNTSVALWHLDIDSELVYVGDKGITEDTGIGSSRKGAEVTASYHLSQAVTLDVEYANTTARFNESLGGSRLIPGALKQVITLGVNCQITDDIFANLKWRHFGDYPLDGGATANGSELVNARMGFNANNQVKITLDVLNLLNSKDHDIEYFYESQLKNESMPMADHHFHVFEPRTARLYVEWAF